jgi:hypothetical protein
MSQREGYLYIDHRASPGIPEELAIKLNLDPQRVKGGQIFESATLRCCHCTVQVIKNPLRTRERYNCMKCGGKYLCDGCAAESRLPGYDHTPFEKKVDIVKNCEARGVNPFWLNFPKIILP